MSFGMGFLLSPTRCPGGNALPTSSPNRLHVKLTTSPQASPIANAMEGLVSREPERLRELAAWYREYAERAGNPAIWDARIRTAEDLETEAARLEPRMARAEI
jgi:hypothetical protein